MNYFLSNLTTENKILFSFPNRIDEEIAVTSQGIYGMKALFVYGSFLFYRRSVRMSLIFIFSANLFLGVGPNVNLVDLIVD